MKISNNQKLVFIFPVILLFEFFVIRLINQNIYHSLVQENSIVEMAQFIFYVFSSIIAGATLVNLHKQKVPRHVLVVYSLFAIGTFVIAMEEISWGQQLFKFATPESVAENNTQNELTIHNLEPVQKLLHNGYILVGIYGSVAWKFAERLLKKFFRDNSDLFIPGFILSLYFLFIAIFYFLLEYIQPLGFKYYDKYFLDPRDQEIFELMLSLAFVLFAYINYKKYLYIERK